MNVAGCFACTYKYLLIFQGIELLNLLEVILVKISMLPPGKKRCQYRILHILYQMQMPPDMRPETQRIALEADRRKPYNPHREGNVQALY